MSRLIFYDLRGRSIEIINASTRHLFCGVIRPPYINSKVKYSAAASISYCKEVNIYRCTNPRCVIQVSRLQHWGQNGQLKVS